MPNPRRNRVMTQEFNAQALMMLDRELSAFRAELDRKIMELKERIWANLNRENMQESKDA